MERREDCSSAALRDPWFKDCASIECTVDADLVVARGLGCLEPTLSLYTTAMEPLESPGGPLPRILTAKAEWLDAPPHAIEGLVVASVTRRSVVLEAETPPYGRVVVKVYKKSSGSEREEAVLKGLRGSPLVPRLLAVYRVEGSPYILVYEAIEGEPLASAFIEAALETLWSSSPRLPGCVAPLGRAVATLHLAMRRLSGRLAPRKASRRDAEAWIARLESRATRLQRLAGGSSEVEEAAEVLRWLASEWRKRGMDILAEGEVQAIHGDLHLYQVYAGRGCRLVFTDFEGEPVKDPGSPWDLEHRERDLAALLRSVAYAAAIAAERAMGSGIDEAARAALSEPLASWVSSSFNEVVRAYGAAWEQAGEEGEPVDLERLRFWILERISYELIYELAYETGYHPVPLWGLLKNPDDYAPRA